MIKANHDRCEGYCSWMTAKKCQTRVQKTDRDRVPLYSINWVNYKGKVRNSTFGNFLQSDTWCYAYFNKIIKQLINAVSHHMHASSSVSVCICNLLVPAASEDGKQSIKYKILRECMILHFIIKQWLQVIKWYLFY